MKQNNPSNKAKTLLSILACFIGLFLLACTTSCATPSPMTQRIALEVENELRYSERGFRFFVSTDITLERLYRDVSMNPRETVIREQTVRTRISLSRNTPGRLNEFEIDGAFNVAFENASNRPTLNFVQNRGSALDDRYYLNWVVDLQTGTWLVDPVTERRIIIYGNEAFLVTYHGEEEPYLQYRRTSRDLTTTRRMRGLR